MSGRTYRFAEVEPLYPFGFGLSYGRLAYAPLNVSAATLREGEELTVRTAVSNAGLQPVEETVQCYLVPPRGWPDAPRAVLVDFTKVSVPAGGGAKIEFKLASAAFRQVDAAGHRVWATGDYEVVVGSASPGPRALALGAPEPARGKIRLA